MNMPSEPPISRSPSTQDEDVAAEREKFEAWMRGKGWADNRFHRSLVNGSYAWTALNDAWEVWQAACAVLADRQQRASSPVVEPVAIEALQRDAARYRYLRDLPISKTGQPGQPCIAMPNGMKSGYYLTEETADHAIDVAMGREFLSSEARAGCDMEKRWEDGND